MLGGIGIGVTVALTGAVGSYYLDIASGASIVVLAIAVFLVLTGGTAILRRLRGTAAARDVTTPDFGFDDEHVVTDA
jgi:zinc transport system permease protein